MHFPLRVGMLHTDVLGFTRIVVKVVLLVWAPCIMIMSLGLTMYHYLLLRAVALA